jgi:hypothetical protein
MSRTSIVLSAGGRGHWTEESFRRANAGNVQRPSGKWPKSSGGGACRSTAKVLETSIVLSADGLRPPQIGVVVLISLFGERWKRPRMLSAGVVIYSPGR